MENDEHLKQKTMVELHDSFIKETPLFVSNSQLREALIQNIVGCFEENIIPRFTKEMKLQGKALRIQSCIYKNKTQKNLFQKPKKNQLKKK